MELVRPPPLLLALVAEGRWRQPSDDAWRRAVPWLLDPDDALGLVPATDFAGSEVYTGFGEEVVDPVLLSTCSPECGPEHVDDPRMVDASRAIIIAMNRVLGSDLAVVLDLRRDADDPRVVASFWVEDGGSGVPHTWREAAPRLSEFVVVLGL